MQLLIPPWIKNEERKAIFSVDFHPDGTKFATGGQGEDSYGRVIIWNLKPILSEEAELDEKVPKILCQLDQHLGCVNSVRWSHSGRLLASAGDDKAIIIWKRSGYGNSVVFGSNVINVETWRIVSTLRGHNGDVLDVAWSPDDSWLASASVDNSVIVWNAEKWPEQVKSLKGHSGMVKGVTWDPTGRYLASQAADRSLRIWRTSNWTTAQQITKPFRKCDGNTTVLRPSWSPDGQYLVSANAMNNGGPTAQIIERENWSIDKDFVGHRRAITCVRFSPNVFAKASSGTSRPVQYCCVAIGSRDRSISIWLTSLQRPLVVIKDVFEDSVLDLAWSKCGRHLMAVSQDGSLAFISFTVEEIGKQLSQEELVALHVKLYGDTAISSRANNCNIIENPEFLKVKQKSTSNAKNKQETRDKEEKRSVPAAAPINKQIEILTADGRRRITPMFIPPPAEGDISTAPVEVSFSSSRQEKSKIVIEKLSGVVEPNVTSPTKSQSSQHSNVTQPTPVAPPAELDSVPVNLASRLQGDGGDVQTTETTRKKDFDVAPIRVKKKRGRKPLNYVMEPEPPAPIEHAPPETTSTAAATAPGLSVPLRKTQILPMAHLPRIHIVQIPAKTNATGFNDTLRIDNDFKTNGHMKSTTSLNRIIRQNPDQEPLWTNYISSNIIAAKVNFQCGVFCCKNKTLHIINLEDGQHILPPLTLKGKVSSLYLHNKCIISLTTEASLSIWDYENKSSILQQSVKHLVENKSGVQNIQLKEIGDKMEPVIILKNGEVFCWNSKLSTWLQLSDSVSMLQYVRPEYAVVESGDAADLGALSSILINSCTYSGSSRLPQNSRESSEVTQHITETFLLSTLNACEYCSSSTDYCSTFKKLVKFYVDQSLESKLRKLFDSLLPTVQPSKTHTILSIDRSTLLETSLAELLYASNSSEFQRLYAEYKDQLQPDFLQDSI